MPAIDLAQLRGEAFELAGSLERPAAFQIALRSLLERHSHRLLRRGFSLADRGALPAWDVPGILIREVEAAILPAGRKNPAAALQAAAAVWAAGRMEEKQLAAFLLGLAGDPAEIRAHLLDWLGETEDPSVLQSLADHACPPLRRADPVLFRSDLRGWITHPAPAQRRFGWLALKAWTEQRSSDAVFSAFELLPLIFAEIDSEALHTAAGLFTGLARTSPFETQGWLSGLTPKAQRQSRKLIRLALPGLPAETADFIRDMRRIE
jgi:hypothetical protein